MVVHSKMTHDKEDEKLIQLKKRVLITFHKGYLNNIPEQKFANNKALQEFEKYSTKQFKGEKLVLSNPLEQEVMNYFVKTVRVNNKMGNYSLGLTTSADLQGPIDTYLSYTNDTPSHIELSYPMNRELQSKHLEFTANSIDKSLYMLHLNK